MSSVFRDNLRKARLYPLTDRSISGLSHADQVSVLADAGISLVQLREKVLSPREFYDEARAAVEVAGTRGVQIVINDRVDIALALKTGVHLGQDDIPPEAARSLLGENAIIGFSTHSLEQAEAAMKMPVDYVAIGPVFSTRTKAGADPVVGLDGVRHARNAGTKPLVAIGGITSENCRSVLLAGADAVAIIGDIWQSASPPEERIRQFIEKTHAL